MTTPERPASVHTITIDRPSAKNALTRAMYTEMRGELERAAQDPSIRVALIEGAHGVFTSGNDLGDFAEAGGDPESMAPVLGFLSALTSFPKPLIAAVDGWAVGIGTTMLLHCDLVYASDRARFKLPFVDLALVPEAGSSLLLPAAIGARRAAQMLLFSEVVDAPTALDWGLINELTTPEALPALATERAARIAQLSPRATSLTKRLLRQTYAEDLREVMDREAKHFGERLRSPDVAEAIGAFFEKRAPRFED